MADINPTIKTSDCWIWGGLLNHGGYGWAYDPVSKTMKLAHRLAYESLVGPIPKGLQLDHLCRNRACVNPEHLEPVTRRINLIRGEGFAGKQFRQTHCKRGHLFDEANTYRRNGHRTCRICFKEWMRARRSANPEENKRICRESRLRHLEARRAYDRFRNSRRRKTS